MNIDFHYYLTFFLCRCSGFTGDESEKVSYSNQFTDDNAKKLNIIMKSGAVFTNSVSYTEKLLPVNKEIQVLLPLHFLPGDLQNRSCRRKDRKKSPINVTPGSRNAEALLKKAFKSRNLFRIGVMLHIYQDTWAHQNFTGIWDDWNAVKGNPFVPDIGHAEVGDTPDMFNKKWTDKRLLSSNASIDNNKRFLDCARHVWEHLCRYRKRQPLLPWHKISRDILTSVKKTRAEEEAKRCEDIRLLYRDYFLENMPEYKKTKWFDEAVLKKTGKYYAREGFIMSCWRRYQVELKALKMEILSYFFQRG